MTRALLAASLLAIAACGHTEAHSIAFRPTAPAAVDPELYFEGRVPARPFYEVGLVQALAWGADADTDAVASALVQRGRLLGCDAVVRAQVVVGSTRAHGFGVCVRFSPTQAAPAPAPAPPSGVSL